ncbi:MAG: efflux RND transporter periplasmic adaptor subunit [Bacteroidota bacterium]
MSSTEKPDLSSLRISRAETISTSESRPARWKYILPPAILIPLVGAFFLIRGGTVIEVDTAAVTLTSPAQASSVLTANGYVVAQRKASVASKGTGRLVLLAVEEGDRVKRGQVIARLEDADVLAELNKARADLEVARADSVDAHSTLLRQQRLMASGLTSQAELDAAQARAIRVNALIRSALAQVEAAGVALENTRIRAPFDGTVLTKDADVGEVVAPFASSANSRGAVVSMADMTSLQVEADVSESNITRVRIGQPCEIVLDAYPDKRYRGSVHKIVPTADRAKATVLTKVAFLERDERVLPEMSAKVAFLSGELSASAAAAPPKTTVVPSVLVERDGRTIAFVVRDGVAVETVVRTGDRLGNLVEVREGLTPGEIVVNHPPAGFSDGTKVKMR